ncbi:hypothetical protein HOA55_02630 [archaeon]|jgi:hypothetical protein|nr:hypothetical protein [archaeon]MBT3577215.1 hypothetical protein [archaeon]MBT6820224.1 hypothetical protein [archaeon]MBT6956745.1 hypothetical protein [archaeon]MBT7025428.1 hypothetical protein [archaeon]
MNSQRVNVAIQAHNFEKESSPDCISCGKIIRHPLCPDCIAKGFKQWVARFPEVEKIISPQVSKFIRGHKHIHKQSERCVACGKRKTSICPYCFTKYLYQLVKEAGAGVRALTEFLFIFNFDFERHGYSDDLEAFGGY